MCKKSYVVVFIIVTVVGRNETSGIKADQIGRVSYLADESCNRINSYKSYETLRCSHPCSSCNTSSDTVCNRNQSYEQIACVNTLVHGDIYMIDRCPSNYSDEEIIAKCQTTDEVELLNDILLYLPTTSPSNVTYKNVFCAVCNGESWFLIWNVALSCQTAGNVTQADPNTLLENLKVDGKNMQLISSFDNAIFKCSVHGYLPYGWTESVQICGSNEKRSICESEPLNERHIDLLFVDLQNPYLPKSRSNLYERLVFNEFDDDLLDSSFQQKCWQHVPRKYDNYSYVDNYTIFVPELDMYYGRNEWTFALAQDTVYVRDIVVKHESGKSLDKYIISIVGGISIFFLTIQIIISVGKEKLHSLPNKVIFSFCITLLAAYIVSRVIKCSMIVAIILHYLYLSYYTWLLIAAYDYWMVICGASRKYQTVMGKKHLKRFLLYCLIGWTLPLVPIAALVYHELFPIEKILRGKLDLCLINKKKLSYRYFSYPCTAICCGVIALFVYTSYYIYKIKRKVLCSTVQINYYKLFVKLALTLGITWTPCFFYMYANVALVNTIFVTLTSAHGTLIFFTYGFEKCWIDRIWYKIRMVCGVKITPVMRRRDTVTFPMEYAGTEHSSRRNPAVPEGFV